MEETLYRGFVIRNYGPLGPAYTFEHQDFDGENDPRHGFAVTLNHARAEIDHMIEEQEA